MIRIDEQKNEVVITLPQTDREDIARMRKTLLDLLIEYNYKEIIMDQSMIYNTTRLIKALDFDIQGE